MDRKFYEMVFRDGKLDPEFKAQWLDALRSGKYVQGRKRLRYACGGAFGVQKHCCLGVAADILDPTAWDEEGYWNGSKGTLQADGYAVCLPDEIQQTLYCMNDVDERLFVEIADFIEENY